MTSHKNTKLTLEAHVSENQKGYQKEYFIFIKAVTLITLFKEKRALLRN